MKEINVISDFGAAADGKTDDFARLQAAIDSAKDGGTVFFPTGVYPISDCLIFYSGQTLRFAADAVLLRMPLGRASEPKELRYMLAAYTENSEKYGGYGGTHDVLIEGGIFDANAELRENQKATIVNTAHCSNITVRGCTFRHCAEWHCIEYNSTRDSVIEDCVFDGPSYTGFRVVNELVQLDAANHGAYGPVFYPDGREMELVMDGTPCRGITIRNNRFICDGFAAIGNHGPGEHTDIRITGNRFEGAPGARGYIAFRPEVTDVCVEDNDGVPPCVTHRTDILDRALRFAMDAHKGQLRKDGKPYILHPLEAAAIAGSMTNDAEVIAATALHDTVEDAGVSPDMLNAFFGERVRDLVLSESENKRHDRPPAETWRERKTESLQALKESLVEAVKILWLSDKLSNLRSLYRRWLEEGEEAFSRFHNTDPAAHAWYYGEILACLSELSGNAAYEEFRTLYNRIFK